MSSDWKVRLRRLFGKSSQEPPRDAAEVSEPVWIEAEDNPWGIRVLDVRPTTLETTSWTLVQEYAENAISYDGETGSSFIGEMPEDDSVVAVDLVIPTDGKLVDGVLFSPEGVEHRWAIYVHEEAIVFVRSWRRTVIAIARFEQEEDHIRISSVQGALAEGEVVSGFTHRTLEYLLRTHGLNQVYPAPLPPGVSDSPEEAGLWCMSAFGSMAHVASETPVPPSEFPSPLRSLSLLHIAVASGDYGTIDQQLSSGTSLTLLAGDGLTPLHWSLSCEDRSMPDYLIGKGVPVDSRSAEGTTPLMNAVQNNQIEHIALLLDRGADVNATDSRGFTALHRAAEGGMLPILDMLLIRGATATTVAEGHTPLSLAVAREHSEVAARLQDKS